MIIKYAFAVGIILLLLFGWVMVQDFYRRFSVNHPELGPYRDNMSGCGGGGCGCSSAGGGCDDRREG